MDADKRSPMRVAIQVCLVLLFVIAINVAIVGHLAGFAFPGPLSFINHDAFWILLTPAFCLPAIFPNGKWVGWKVGKSSGFLSGLFWIGMATLLIIGTNALISGR